MKHCPITYQACEGRYSKEGLRLLSPLLTSLHDFPYSCSKQLQLAIDYSDKLSFSGVQPKLNAKLNIEKEIFEPVRTGGTFILKLPHDRFEQLPQNEDLTMKLAKIAGIEVPFHGLMYAIDGSLVYFIQRFDRKGKKKISIEDLGQLAGLPKEAKYDFSMEKVAKIIETYCTFSALEKGKLLHWILFNFLVGNEDMHVKNFSVIRQDDVVKLTPAYDLVNSTLIMHSKEEMALPLNGKKSNFKRADFIDYFGKEKLGLTQAFIEEILFNLQEVIPQWKELIAISFLTKESKDEYMRIVEQRTARLFY